MTSVRPAMLTTLWGLLLSVSLTLSLSFSGMASAAGLADLQDADVPEDPLG